MVRRVLPLVSYALVVSVSSSACGLVFGGSRQMVRVESNPTAAAIVTSPSTADYTTPASMSLQRKQNYSLTLSAPGYASRTVEIQREMRVGILVLDIVFGLVPVIVDAATGAWYRLEPTVSTVSLTRTTAGGDQPDTIVVSLTSTKDNRLQMRASSSGVRAVIAPR